MIGVKTFQRPGRSLFAGVLLISVVLFSQSWQVKCQEDLGCLLTTSICESMGKIFEPLFCRCSCNDTLCEGGVQVPNENNSCICECPGETPRCPLPQVYNETSCKCECQTQFLCTLPQQFSEDICACTCLNPQACVGGNRFNFNTCECACPLTNNSCAKNQILDSTMCECVCPSRADLCTDLQFLNDTSCECQCSQFKNCPTSMFFNTDTCACQCRQLVFCKEPLVYDSESCTCTCVDQICTGKQTQNPETCECGCQNNCPNEKMEQNPVSCRCSCALKRPCSRAQYLDLETCDCVCPNGRTPESCKKFQTFNETSCECDCRYKLISSEKTTVPSPIETEYPYTQPAEQMPTECSCEESTHTRPRSPGRIKHRKRSTVHQEWPRLTKRRARGSRGRSNNCECDSHPYGHSKRNIQSIDDKREKRVAINLEELFVSSPFCPIEHTFDYKVCDCVYKN